jgi:hypothetical protein
MPRGRAFVSERLIEAVAGKERRLIVLSEDYQRTWTTVYPTAAARHLVELYMMLEQGVSPKQLELPLLVFANPGRAAAAPRPRLLSSHRHHAPSPSPVLTLSR